MEAFPTHPRRPSRREVQEALSAIDFPLDKEDVVRVAEQSLADEAVTRELRALPLGTYAWADEVLRSVENADQVGP